MIYYTIIFIYIMPERLVFWLVYYVEILEQKQENMMTCAITEKCFLGSLRGQPEGRTCLLWFCHHVLIVKGKLFG